MPLFIVVPPNYCTKFGAVTLPHDASIMALPNWMHLVLRLIHDISHFLLFNATEEPTYQTTRPANATTIAPPESLSHSTIFSGIGERTIDLVAGLLGVALPRAVTIVSDLPAATAALLRLTEIIPADVVLFLCLSGLLLWSLLFVSFVLIIVVLFVRVLIRLKQTFVKPTREVVTFAPDNVILPESDDEASARALRSGLRALPHQRCSDTRIANTPRRTPITFSDAAISLSDTVAAHSRPLNAALPAPKRRTRRTIE